MKKKASKKLKLHRETLRPLEGSLDSVNGGITYNGSACVCETGYVPCATTGSFIC